MHELDHNVVAIQVIILTPKQIPSCLAMAFTNFKELFHIFHQVTIPRGKIT